MHRRDFLTLAGAAAACPRVALAQQATKVPLIVILSAPLSPGLPEALLRGLADYGYIDGKNVQVAWVTAPTNDDLPAFAAKAVALKPDIIWAFGGIAAPAAAAATRVVPIVFTNSSDPLAIGLVPNLAHPGGNVTGASLTSTDFIPKQMQIINEAVPGLKRIALLNIPTSPPTVLIATQASAAARALGMEPVLVDFIDTQAVASQLPSMVEAGAQAVYVPVSTYISTGRDALFDLQIAQKLPMISSSIIDGSSTPFIGVISYGASASGTARGSAKYVDAILKGAKAGDLPVEEPTVFDFAVNLNAARKIGITIPPSILAQATLVVDEDWRAPKGVAK